MTRRIGWLIARTCGLAILALTATTHRPGAASAACKACNSYCFWEGGVFKCSKATCGDAAGDGNVTCTNLESGGCAMTGTCKLS